MNAPLSSYLTRDVTVVAAVNDPIIDVLSGDTGLKSVGGSTESLLGVDETEHDDVTVTASSIGWLAPRQLSDIAPIHLLTDSSLRWLSALAPASDWNVRRFRPNTNELVSTPVENGWAGKRLRIGTTEIEVALPMARCIMTTLAQPGLPRDRNILQTLATA